MLNSELTVTWQPIEALHVYANNAREHPFKRCCQTNGAPASGGDEP